MTQPIRARQAGEPAPLVLVCDDRALGEALLDAIGHAGAPIFDVSKAAGGWEVLPAGTVVLFERAPDLDRTRRRLRFARGARTVVVAWPDQPRLIELVLREQGTVIRWPGSLPRLAEELRRCLDAAEGAVVIEPERLAEELCHELSRRLLRSAPHLRLADATRVEALVDKLTCAILEEARELEGAPIAELDWETVPTDVQTREASAKVRKRAAPPDGDPGPTRPLRPPLVREPDPISLMETRPYAPPTDEEVDELLAHVEMLDEDEAAGREPSRPPPLPARPSVPAVALPPPRRAPAWLAVLIALGAASLGGAFAWSAAPPLPPRTVRPMAAPPRATLELGAPTVTPALAPPPPPVLAPPPAPATIAEAPGPTSTREARASRAAVRARAHLRHGRLDRALRSARFAARLAPEVEGHAALVAEIEALAPVTEAPESAMLAE